MKKNALGKILVAAVAALVLSFGLVACGGTSTDGNAAGGDDNSGEAAAPAADAGVDPLMYQNKDGELEEGIWNYSAQYVMASVYGDAAQTNTAIQLVCADGKFTCDQPDQGIDPFMDEWNEFMGEGTYTWEYDADGVPTVTFEFNGATATTTVDLDYGEMEIPATLFDPDSKNSYDDVVNDTVIPHSELTCTFVQY